MSKASYNSNALHLATASCYYSDPDIGLNLDTRYVTFSK